MDDYKRPVNAGNTSLLEIVTVIDGRRIADDAQDLSFCASLEMLAFLAFMHG